MHNTANMKQARRLPALVAVTITALGLSGCAQTSFLESLADGLGNTSRMADAKVTPKTTSNPNELPKATAYWGQQYAKDPKNPQLALNYARNLRALGDRKRALAVLENTRRLVPNNREITAEIGRLAVEAGQLKMAEKMLARAGNAADWKTVSAKGALEAQRGNYKAAQALFSQALEIAPGKASLINNLALAYALDGQAEKAETLLRKVVEGGKATPKVRQNLALVLGLQGKFDEARDVTAKDLPVTLASANEDYMRKMLNLPAGAAKSSRAKAIAAASSGTWNTAVNTAVKTGLKTAKAGAPLKLTPAGQ